MLTHRMYATKAARFNADKRLRLEHKLSYISLTLISAYLIALSAAPTFKVNLLPPGTNYDFWSLVFSVAVLGISSLQIGTDRTREAFFLHKNAMEIDRLFGEISSHTNTNVTTDMIEDFNDRYSTIKESCEFNHCKIDELLFKTGNSWLPLHMQIFHFLVWLIYATFHYGAFIISIVAPIIVVAYLHL